MIKYGQTCQIVCKTTAFPWLFPKPSLDDDTSEKMLHMMTWSSLPSNDRDTPFKKHTTSGDQYWNDETSTRCNGNICECRVQINLWHSNNKKHRCWCVHEKNNVVNAEIIWNPKEVPQSFSSQHGAMAVSYFCSMSARREPWEVPTIQTSKALASHPCFGYSYGPSHISYKYFPTTWGPQDSEVGIQKTISLQFMVVISIVRWIYEPT